MPKLQDSGDMGFTSSLQALQDSSSSKAQSAVDSFSYNTYCTIYKCVELQTDYDLDSSVPIFKTWGS
jgi:hypothetical protein